MYDFSKPWFNSDEAAAYLGLSVGALRNMIYEKDIPVYRLKKRLRFKKEELDKILIKDEGDDNER